MPEPKIPEPILPEVKEVVKEAVKEVITTSDVSWIRRDWIVLGALFVVLGVLSVVQVVSLNRVEQAVGNTDLIAECTTPGTRCFELAKENKRKEQEYFTKLTTDASLCILLTSGAVNTGEIAFEPEPIETYYTKCVMDRIPPPPHLND